MGWDVNPDDLKNHLWVPGQEGYRQANWNYAWYNNPYFAAEKLNQQYNENILKGNMNLAWDLTKDLSISGRASAITTYRFEDRKSPKSYLNYGDPREGDYKTWNREWLTVDNDIHATYRKQLSSKINLTVNAGAAAFISQYQHYYSATDGLVVPEVYSLSNTQNPVKAESYLQKKTIRSIYATADLDIIDVFYLNLSYRNDWSSALPKSNQSYFYPSASLSVMLSNLFNMPDALDYLKIYGSWASVRNDFAPKVGSNATKTESENSTAKYAGFENPYQLQSYYYNIGSYNGMTMLSYPSNIVNPDIRPDLTNTYELGLSSSAWKNRAGFSFTYYNTVQTDNIIPLDLTQSTGFSSRLINGNEYTTNGIEFEITGKPVKSKNLTWSFAANISHYVTKLTGIYGDSKRITIPGMDGNGLGGKNISLNERVDNLYATGWAKTPDGKVIINEETGLPSKDPYPQLFGHTQPDVWYGMQNSFNMGKFTVNIDFDGNIGGVMYSRTVAKMWWAGKTPESTTYRDEQYATENPVYTPEGVNLVSGELVRDADGNIVSDTRVFKENTTKVNWQTWSQNYPYRAHVGEDESKTFANVFDRSFLKVRRIAASYDMSAIAKNFLHTTKMEVTLFCYDVFILKKAKSIDPDFGRDDELQDPSSRYVGINLNFKF